VVGAYLVDCGLTSKRALSQQVGLGRVGIQSNHLDLLDRIGRRHYLVSL